MPRLLFIPLLFLFLRCHAQSQLKLDYFPLALVADFHALKGVKEATALNTLIVDKDTVLKKEVTKWFRYRNDSVVDWMNKEIFTRSGGLDFASEERYESPCMMYKRHSYYENVNDQFWSKHCRYTKGKTFYQVETNYAGARVIRKHELAITSLSDTERKWRWREWHHDTLVVDSARRVITPKYTPREIHAPKAYYSNDVFMTRDDKGKPVRYSKDTYNGFYQEYEAWDYVYTPGETNAGRVDYSKWSETGTYGPVPAVWLDRYVGNVPTRAVYRKSDGGQEIVFIIEVVIK